MWLLENLKFRMWLCIYLLDSAGLSDYSGIKDSISASGIKQLIEDMVISEKRSFFSDKVK